MRLGVKVFIVYATGASCAAFGSARQAVEYVRERVGRSDVRSVSLSRIGGRLYWRSRSV